MNFKKKVNGSWTDTPHYVHNTSTDTITTLPAVIHPTGTTATVGLKGNAVQSSTPSPTSPVMPQGCGDLEATGEHAGQYKIPISSADTTTPVYLGEVETTRKIKKYEFTGTEALLTSGSGNTRFFYTTIVGARNWVVIMSDRYVNANISSTSEDIGIAMSGNSQFRIRPDLTSTVDDFKAYLSAQYAAGTPVTVWYVLATEETAVVNEPLMKIGNFADEVSNISIPVTAGGDTLSVDTTVQLSEVTVNYKGWHPVADVHERESGQWD